MCLLQLPCVSVHRPDCILYILAAGFQPVQGPLDLLGQVAEFLEIGKKDFHLGALLRERRPPLGDHACDYEKAEGCGSKVDMLGEMRATLGRDSRQE